MPRPVPRLEHPVARRLTDPQPTAATRSTSATLRYRGQVARAVHKPLAALAVRPMGREAQPGRSDRAATVGITLASTALVVEAAVVTTAAAGELPSKAVAAAAVEGRTSSLQVSQRSRTSRRRELSGSPVLRAAGKRCGAESVRRAERHGCAALRPAAERPYLALPAGRRDGRGGSDLTIEWEFSSVVDGEFQAAFSLQYSISGLDDWSAIETEKLTPVVISGGSPQRRILCTVIPAGFVHGRQRLRLAAHVLGHCKLPRRGGLQRCTGRPRRRLQLGAHHGQRRVAAGYAGHHDALDERHHSRIERHRSGLDDRLLGRRGERADSRRAAARFRHDPLQPNLPVEPGELLPEPEL